MDIWEKVQVIEGRYYGKGGIRNNLALCLRYYLSYKLTGEQVNLSKARAAAREGRENNLASVELLMMGAFLEWEAGNAKTTRELLDYVKPLRNSYKNGNPEYYARYVFLEGLIDIRNGKIRSANKNYERLNQLSELYEAGEIYLLMGGLNIAFGEYGDALVCLKYACRKGVNSPLLYLWLQEALEESQAGQSDVRLVIMPYILWALQQNADLSLVLDQYREAAAEKLSENPARAKRLYESYPLDWILSIICTSLMESYDFSEKAFGYYKKAETKQLMLPGLSDYMVRAACKNGIEDLSRHSLEDYIRNPDLPLDMRPFVYHLLIGDEKYKSLLAGHKSKILQFGFYCLENRLVGRYYYTLYKYMLDAAAAGETLDGEYAALAENMVKNALFTFDVRVSDPRVKSLWVFQKEKKENSFWEVKNGTARVTAWGPDFTCYCFGESGRTLLYSPVKIIPMVENADRRLYERFFRKKYLSGELLIALSSAYMEYSVINSAFPGECESIFEKTIADPTISKSFRARVSAALGNFHAVNGNYGKAVGCYANLDENILDDRDIEQMFLCYVNGGDLKRATGLIEKKAHCISDRNLFFGLKKIAAEPGYRSYIADAAYELVLKSWYDKALIDIVLKYYKGSQEEWQELSRALTAMSVSEKALDEIILKNAIWIKRADEGAQRVFERMYAMEPDSPLTASFAYYLCYEMIINNFRPRFETADILEKIFIEKEDGLTAWALCGLYINHGVSTSHSREIIIASAALCEREGFIFPPLKAIKDKNLMTPYIERNQPFLYRSVPGKDVRLHYKVKGETDYREKPMDYIRFGLYGGVAAVFSGEEISYHFSEEMATGSIVTKDGEIENSRMQLEENPKDLYCKINNALVYAQMFKFEKAEEIINTLLRERPEIRGQIV